MQSRRATLRRMLILGSSLLVAISSPAPADGLVARSETLGLEAPRGLSVQANPRAKETLYRPAYDTWTLYDLRMYPILRRAADGASVSVVSVRGTHRYRLSEEEIANFARIVALYGDESLPEPAKPKSAPEDGPEKRGLTNPQIIRSTRIYPEFPVMARDKMARGKVTLQAVVREDGSADVIEVLKSSARYCGFEQAAIDALRQWRYEPGRQDGKPVDVYFTIDFDFIWR